MGEDTEEETKDKSEQESDDSGGETEDDSGGDASGDETEEATDDSKDETEDDSEEIDEEVDVEEARLLSGRNKVRVLDVRSQEDVAEGTIPGAMWSDEDRLVEMARYVLRGDDIPVMVVCSNGSESEEMAEKLRNEDIKACYIKGGFKSWDAKGYPQDPRKDAEYEGPDITMPGTGGSMGGDSSAEESKIEVSAEYYEGQEDKTGTHPIDARAETAVDERDLEASKKFERDSDLQREGLLDEEEENDNESEGENEPEADGSDDVDSSDGSGDNSDGDGVNSDGDGDGDSSDTDSDDSNQKE